jgi:hypothetical protein
MLQGTIGNRILMLHFPLKDTNFVEAGLAWHVLNVVDLVENDSSCVFCILCRSENKIGHYGI